MSLPSQSIMSGGTALYPVVINSGFNYTAGQVTVSVRRSVSAPCMRELHSHQNADEWQYYMSGKARMTIVGTGARARTMDFEAGDVGYVEKTLPHYIENTGDEDLRYLEVFRAPRFEDLSVSECLSHSPFELVMAHLKIDRSTYEQIPKEKLVVVRR